MARELRATRYLRRGNEGLARFISSELHYLDFQQTLAFYDEFARRGPVTTDVALLGANDRYFLFTGILGRKDGLHPWIFDRAREVEADPDGHLDLWAREHYKSSLITYAGSIQEIVVDPEITIGLFSHTRKIAQGFLRQVMREMEVNEQLKRCYADVLWQNPRREAPKWSEADGIVVKRKTNPKEATIEAWGLIDGQPTSKHFRLLNYDDVVTRENVTNAEQIKKTTEGYELSDNLTADDYRKWMTGTRYSFADTYGELIERKVVKVRLHPATDNGREDGNPVLFTQEKWDEKRKTQRTTLSAQMLQNPAAGSDATFQLSWLRPWMKRPATLNISIMGDPSMGQRRKNSDRTAIAVVGTDANNNKYLLDGFCHRMHQHERWLNLRMLRRKWLNAPGVQQLLVGWERYGMQTDKEYFERQMRKDKVSFDILELNWSREGNLSKRDRVERLQPDFMGSGFYLPGFVWHHVYGDSTLWAPNLETNQIDFRRFEGNSRQMKVLRHQHQDFLLPGAIKRQDEEGIVYDLTRRFIEEYMFFPFGSKDDLIDAVSRVYDMEQMPPKIHEQQIEDLVPDYPDS